MKQLGEIKLINKATELIIEIEGVIGVPEDWQFESDDQRVATYERFRATLESIEATSAGRVTVHIRSVGGAVHDALLMYDSLCALAERGVEVTSVCHGYVASAATIVAQGAARRCISSDTLYLIHNATTTLEGNSHDATRTADLLTKTDERIASIYALRSSLPAAHFRELMNRDGGRGEWLSPEEVIEYGLADTIREVSPMAVVKDRLRNFFGRSGSVVSNAVLRILDDSTEGNGRINTDVEDVNEQHADQITALSDCVAELRATVDRLGAENSRLGARPTATLPKEDPDVEMVDRNVSVLGNQKAYVDDVKSFRPGL